jgi:hypothetical protein
MKIPTILSIVCLLALSIGNGWAEIIVRQDKDGNLTISNDYTGEHKKYKGYRKTSGGVTFTRPANSMVPTKYLLKIRRLSRKYEVKESLIIAIALAESGFNPFAVSKKGAVGIMQLMPDTARKYGVVNRYNADQNLDAGVRHIRYLDKKYNGNLKLVLAAYNAGEEAVKKYKGVPPYQETRNYIRRVFRFMGMSHSGVFSPNISTKIYQYRTKDGQIMITDSFPKNAMPGTVTIIE